MTPRPSRADKVEARKRGAANRQINVGQLDIKSLSFERTSKPRLLIEGVKPRSLKSALVDDRDIDSMPRLRRASSLIPTYPNEQTLLQPPAKSPRQRKTIVKKEPQIDEQDIPESAGTPNKEVTQRRRSSRLQEKPDIDFSPQGQSRRIGKIVSPQKNLRSILDITNSTNKLRKLFQTKVAKYPTSTSVKSLISPKKPRLKKDTPVALRSQKVSKPVRTQISPKSKITQEVEGVKRPVRSSRAKSTAQKLKDVEDSGERDYMEKLLTSPEPDMNAPTKRLSISRSRRVTIQESLPESEPDAVQRASETDDSTERASEKPVSRLKPKPKARKAQKEKANKNPKPSLVEKAPPKSKPSKTLARRQSRQAIGAIIPLTKTRASERQKPLVVDVERLSSEDRVKPTAIDVIQQLVESFEPASYMGSSSTSVNPQVVHEVFKSHLLYHLGTLVDVTSSIATLSAEIASIQRKKENLRKQMYELRLKHSEVGNEMNSLREELQSTQTQRDVVRSIDERVESLKAFTSGANTGIEAHNISSEVELGLHEINRVVNSVHGTYAKLLSINERLPYYFNDS